MASIRHHMLYDSRILLTVVDIQMTVNHNSSLKLWVHWLSRSRCGRHIWASFKEALSHTHAICLWQHETQAGPPPGQFVACHKFAE